MNDYTQLCKDLLEDEIAEQISYDKSLDRDVILRSILHNGTEDIFGNMTGSRTCNTYEAEQFINKSGAMFDDDIIDMFNELGDDYFTDTLKRGPETLDVVILELLSNQIINEMLGE
jgi:hypothetical protein